MIDKKIKKRTYKIKIKTTGFKKKFQKKSKSFFEIFLKKPWANYIGQINSFAKEKKILSAKALARKKRFSFLNQKLEKAKLSPFFFKPWMKGQKFFLTARQKHLKDIYHRSNNHLALKERKDFFKTSFGEILKSAYLHSPDVKGLWVSSRILLPYKMKKKRKKGLSFSLNKKGRKKRKKNQIYLKKVPWFLVKSHKKQYQSLINPLQKGWLYETLFRKNQSRHAKYFELDRPQTAFQNHFKQQKKEPWLDPLIFKRWAYFGLMERNRKELLVTHHTLKFKEYLRKRNPRFQKRNKLYWWRRKLLFQFYHNNRIKKKKAQRIKQVLGKIYLPFYGNLKKKQFTSILKKSKKKKSQLLNRNEKILSSLENRLDVVVYRLNLAPNILWARRLIQEGSIFVSNMFSFQNWILMYSQIKHFAFPLKLRDPKSLYKTKNWLPNKHLSKFKFLLKPIKKIHYLVQPGDLIQSAKSLKINKIKNNTRLLKKPIHNNFYTIKKIQKYSWSHPTKSPKAFSFFKWKEPVKHITASLFLFDARFTDLKRNDRARELFFRWITL